MINNKVHSTTKVSLFMANYGRELRMGVNLRRKGKSDRVCRKDEKGTGKSRSNIKESIVGDEETSG